MNRNSNKTELLLLLFIEYLAWFIGWNYALVYQLAALTVVVDWSKYVVHFINLFSNYNVTSSVVGAPIAWDETALSFYITGQAINLPAIAITIAMTLLLISGIRPTAIVNLVLVVIKIIILLIFIFACCKYVDLNNYKPFFPKNEGK
jgi:APA family basic amino acid/polyamine antiporter